MTELAALNVKITGDASALKAAVAAAQGDLGKLAAAANAAGLKVTGLGNKFTGAGAAAGNFSNVARGAAQQLSQVGQQTMATGNFIQALAIQLPDLGLAFGAVGAAVGLVAGVALPLLIGALSGGSGGALSFADAMDAANAAMEDTDRLAGLVSGDIAAIGDAYGVLTPQIWSLIEAQRQVGFAELSQSADGLVKSLGNLYSYSALYGSAGEQMAGALDLGAKSAEHFALTLEYLKGELTLDQQIAQVAAIRQEFEATVGPVGSMTAAQREFYMKLVDAENALVKVHRRTVELSGATATVSRAFESAKKALSDMVAAQPGAGWLSPAISQAEKLAEKLWDAATAAASINSISASASGMGGGITGAPSVSTGPASGSGSIRIPSSGAGAGGGGGGGGGGANPIVSELETLQQSLVGQEQAQIESFARQQEVLRSALEQRLITQQEYAALMEASQRQHAETMEGIDVWRYGSGLAKAEAFFGGMADALAAGNEKMQKVSQSFAAVEALINAWRAYSQTLADPSLPFATKFLAAAKVLAAGMGAVNAIRNGGRSAAGGGAATAQSAPAQASPLQVSLNTYGFGDMIRTSDLGGLLTQLNNAAGDRGYTILVPRT